MAGGGGGSKAARAAPTTAIHSTIQSIKEVVGGHSDADIYAALRESNMDPNETAQKLLNQDPFHEVKRKRDKKRESAGQKSFAETEARAEHGSQYMKPHTQWVESDQRRPYNPGPRREFRVVRDNRHSVVENRSELGHEGSTFTQVSDRSGAVVQLDRNQPPATTSEGQMTHQTAKHSYNSETLQVKREAQGTTQRHARPYLTNTPNEYHLPTSDPAHGPSNYKAAGGSVGAIRRQAGVVNAPRQYSGRSGSQLHVSSGTFHANNQRGNFASAGPSGRQSAFMSRSTQPNHRPALDTASRGRSIGRSFVNQNINKYHQGSASNQKAKEWKPKSTNKSSTNDADNRGTDAVSPDNNTENANVLDVNSLCDKTSHANMHEMEHVIIPEHLRVPEYEQTRLRFGSFTLGFDSDQLPASTSPESEQPEQCRGDVAELKESSITTLQEPDVLLGTSSTSPQAAAHDTMEVSPPSGCLSLGLPILVRTPPDWYYTFYIRIDLSGSFHTYPALDGPFLTLEEADTAIDRYLRHQLDPTMCEKSLNELPDIDSAVRRAMYWPDGARKKGWKCPVKIIPDNLLIQASLDQYNEDRNPGLAYELKDVLRRNFFFSKEGTYKHFNFTAKTKGADDFDSGILFFAEFKFMPERQHIVAGCCCMVKPDDKGHCYGCANSGKADMQHPNEAGAYSCGDVSACCPGAGVAAPIDWIGFEESVEGEEKRLKRMFEDIADSRAEAILYKVGRITAN